ncbi:hypothetical protein [Agromyces badenianii]|uniref:hypothetical protein n=1 Tax=Agromyces badenianii TaxID=2080742 RepID=UPI000D58EDE9|nr:hypothetical protein [Agromyces badenianii]PWC05404.1 hypothetical protein DCE94_03790 [Agromyces badenianii]
MARAIVNTPVKGFTGTVVGVAFVDGTADVDGEAQLAYFERQGYEVIYAPSELEVVEIPNGDPVEVDAELVELADGANVLTLHEDGTVERPEGELHPDAAEVEPAEKAEPKPARPARGSK